MHDLADEYALLRKLKKGKLSEVRPNLVRECGAMLSRVCDVDVEPSVPCVSDLYEGVCLPRD